MKNFKFKIEGKDYVVSVKETENNLTEVKVNDKTFTVEVENQTLAKTSVNVPSTIKSSKKGLENIKAPLPGSIVKILVSDGQSVKRGDVLLIMESMKMENNICAEHDGIVKSIKVNAGQGVMQDDLLIIFEGTEEEEIIIPSKQQTATKSSPSNSTDLVKSPLPGSIVKILVSEGQSIKRGDVLLVMESMKMENNILANKDGVVKAIHVQEGKTVMQDDPLVDLQ